MHANLSERLPECAFDGPRRLDSRGPKSELDALLRIAGDEGRGLRRQLARASEPCLLDGNEAGSSSRSGLANGPLPLVLGPAALPQRFRLPGAGSSGLLGRLAFGLRRRLLLGLRVFGRRLRRRLCRGRGRGLLLRLGFRGLCRRRFALRAGRFLFCLLRLLLRLGLCLTGSYSLLARSTSAVRRTLRQRSPIYSARERASRL